MISLLSCAWCTFRNLLNSFFLLILVCSSPVWKYSVYTNFSSWIAMQSGFGLTWITNGNKSIDGILYWCTANSKQQRYNYINKRRSSTFSFFLSSLVKYIRCKTQNANITRNTKTKKRTQLRMNFQHVCNKTSTTTTYALALYYYYLYFVIHIRSRAEIFANEHLMEREKNAETPNKKRKNNKVKRTTKYKIINTLKKRQIVQISGIHFNYIEMR